MGRNDGERRIAIEVRGTVNGAQVVAEGEARVAVDGSEVDLRIETREDALGWDPAPVAPAVVDGVQLAAPLAISDEDGVSATLATQTELVDEDGRDMGRARIMGIAQAADGGADATLSLQITEARFATEIGERVTRIDEAHNAPCLPAGRGRAAHCSTWVVGTSRGHTYALVATTRVESPEAGRLTGDQPRSWDVEMTVGVAGVLRLALTARAD